MYSIRDPVRFGLRNSLVPSPCSLKQATFFAYGIQSCLVHVSLTQGYCQASDAIPCKVLSSFPLLFVMLAHSSSLGKLVVSVVGVRLTFIRHSVGAPITPDGSALPAFLKAHIFVTQAAWMTLIHRYWGPRAVRRGRWSWLWALSE